MGFLYDAEVLTWSSADFSFSYNVRPLLFFSPRYIYLYSTAIDLIGHTMNVRNMQGAIRALIVVDCCVHRSTQRIYLVVCFCGPHYYEILMTDRCFASIFFLETTRA